MPTFVSLINWTEQGVASFKDTVARSADARTAAAAMGGQIKDIYWTVGPYDLVTVAEFPDDETATAFLLALSSRGNLRTTTLRAFGTDEMSQIIGKVS
jgi:uncharacterized protein with GYD domain